MASLAPSSSSKFKLFALSRARSPASRKREPPPVLTLGPLSPQDRWEAETDGDAQEFCAQDATSEQNTHVRTAPLTLSRAPSPLYPQHPHTAGPGHHAHFLAPSPHLPPGLQHPFSAHYDRERGSQESDRERATKDLQRARDANVNERRVASSPRDEKDIQMRGRSPDPRRRGFYAPATTILSPQSMNTLDGIESVSAADGEVDLDIYPWFIFQQGKSEDLTKGTRDSDDDSFMPL